MCRQIHHAAQNPVALDRRQAASVEARIILDLKVGAAFTRMQTLTLQSRIGELAVDNNVISYGGSFPGRDRPPNLLMNAVLSHVQVLVSSLLWGSWFSGTIKPRALSPSPFGTSTYL